VLFLLLFGCFRLAVHCGQPLLAFHKVFNKKLPQISPVNMAGFEAIFVRLFYVMSKFSGDSPTLYGKKAPFSTISSLNK
jgi:hypothetical protein